MSDEPSDYLRLLLAHDDASQWEAPPGHDAEAAESRFLAFAEEFLRRVGVRCRVEASATVQDATVLGQIFLDGWLLAAPPAPPATVLLRVSNWGDFATVSDEEAVNAEALALIRDLLAQFGYTYIPPAILARPYTGAWPGAKPGVTWWLRYFDWS